MTETTNNVASLIQSLGYEESTHFVQGASLTHDRDNGHIYRKAQTECSLEGVYQLTGAEFRTDASNIPVLYVCSAESDEEADQIHRLVWNQNIVPFLLVVCRSHIRLYSGFRYSPAGGSSSSDRDRGLLVAGVELSKATEAFKAFSAESIDKGILWQHWGNEVTTEHRVDWTLITNLEQLGQLLDEEGLARSLSHALIGKFVYLHYLRARNILSDRKLAKWDLTEAKAFGRDVTIASFSALLSHLQAWLNGAVFPISRHELSIIGQARLRIVASVFLGDTPAGQAHLAFEAYNFSFIPIETLSVIYEQFLHAEIGESGLSRGREGGAYYTPVPLVNYVIDELERLRPLNSGMRVLDPSCGSGVFLVQCFRKLIERRLRESPSMALRPSELREMLVGHIFGIDVDADACRVAELSLILTLLDYVTPPDLESTSNFKLPALRDSNLLCGDAFDARGSWRRKLESPFDWVVGNPPWKNLSSVTSQTPDRLALAWMKQNAVACPTGGHQIAEAFAWLSLSFGADSGVAGLLMPASVLFKHESRRFRKSFFSKASLQSVANFANYAEVLFGGRSRVPAAALFFTCAPPLKVTGSVDVYSPLIANQATRSFSGRAKRQETWCIVVNAGEIRQITYNDVLGGEAVPWKLAMWGSPLDRKIIRATESKFTSLSTLREKSLRIAEGFQLRLGNETGAGLDHHPELAGRLTLNVNKLKRLTYLHKLPADSFLTIDKEKTFVRKRGGYDLPLEVCSPPHILVGASRTFFVLSTDFVVLPPRQIGIRHRTGGLEFLKALTLYLNSDFALYHQFLTSPEVKRPVATLKSLLRLPIPFSDEDRDSLREWVLLYELIDNTQSPQSLFGASDAAVSLQPFLTEINALTFKALGMDKRLQASVKDLVHTKRCLVDGQVGERAMKVPDDNDVNSYMLTLQEELDSFLGSDVDARHRITALRSEDTVMVELQLISGTTEKQSTEIFAAGEKGGIVLSSILQGFRQKRSQWVYFDRNVRMYRGPNSYLVKPMHRFHWTSSQAYADAQSLIAETLCQDLLRLETTL